MAILETPDSIRKLQRALYLRANDASARRDLRIDPDYRGGPSVRPGAVADMAARWLMAFRPAFIAVVVAFGLITERAPAWTALSRLHARRMKRSLELEVRAVDRVVVQLHEQLAARILPRRVGFPDIAVGVGRRIITEAARGSRDGHLDVVRRRRR